MDATPSINQVRTKVKPPGDMQAPRDVPSLTNVPPALKCHPHWCTTPNEAPTHWSATPTDVLPITDVPHPQWKCHPLIDAVVLGGGGAAKYLGLWGQISCYFYSSVLSFFQQIFFCQSCRMSYKRRDFLQNLAKNLRICMSCRRKTLARKIWGKLNGFKERN